MLSRKQKLNFSQTPFLNFGKYLVIGMVAGILLLLTFALLARGVLLDELEQFDQTITAIVQYFAGDILTKFAIFITHSGSAYIKIAIFLILAWFLLFRLKHVWETVILACSLLGGWLLNELLKVIFHRSRPDIQHLVEAGGYSFPSGHAMTSMTFYGMCAYLIWLNLRQQNKPSWYVIVLTFVWILLIGTSRVYLGVHFPSDVIAGFAAGGVWLIACILALHVIQYYKGERPNQ